MAQAWCELKKIVRAQARLDAAALRAKETAAFRCDPYKYFRDKEASNMPRMTPAFSQRDVETHFREVYSDSERSSTYEAPA